MNLQVEKALLDSLVQEIERLESVAFEIFTFNSNYASILSTTTGTVVINDRFIVEDALYEYDLLSSDAKAQLTTEKVLLDSLLQEIIRQEDIISEISLFKTTHAIALGLDLTSVQISDRSSIEVALASYNLLSSDAKLLLTAEKALLDSLLIEIIIQEAIAFEVTTFKQDHLSTLTFTDSSVSISNLSSVDSALLAYESLSDDAKASTVAELMSLMK